MAMIDGHRSSVQPTAETVVLAIFLVAAMIAAFAICGLLTLVFGPLSAWVWFSGFIIEGAAATIVASAISVGAENSTTFIDAHPERYVNFRSAGQSK
jgi:formate hydrogenlyase subunit 3/multisubunit Na+/H+ antiporter MnhD subunit